MAMVPLVTPAAPGAVIEDILTDLREIIAGARYRVGDGAAAAVSAVIAAHHGLPADWAVVTFRSGTDALVRALDAVGVRPGSRVAVPDLAYHAVAGVVLMAGAVPVICDVEPHGWQLDPAAVRQAIRSGGLDAVIAVDNFGSACARRELGSICRAAGVPLVLDACESLGATAPDDPVHEHVDAIALSFSFTKPVHAAGAGGALALRSDRAEAVLARPHLLSRQVQLPELNAAYLVRTWSELPSNIARLRRQYDAYRSVLEPLGFVPQHEQGTGTRIHAPFLVPASWAGDGRDRFIEALAADGIEARAMFPSQARLLGLGAPPPVSAEVDRRVVCVPTGAGLHAPDLPARVAACATAAVAS